MKLHEFDNARPILSLQVADATAKRDPLSAAEFSTLENTLGF